MADGPCADAFARRALWTLCAAAVAAFSVLAITAVLYPHQTSYVEGYLLEQGARLAEGDALYRPIGEPAWVVDNFPPLYPLAMAVGVKLFGASFAFGRVLTIVSAAGLFVFALLWHRRGGCPPVVAFGLATLWLSSPYVVRRALLVRMDLAAILLVSLAVGLYLLLHKRRPALAAPVAALAFAAALGIRQTMIAAPLALIATMVWHERRRDTTLLFGILVLLGFTAAWMLQSVTNGQFLEHTIGHNTGRYLVDHYLLRLWWTWKAQWLILSLGAIGAVIAFRRATFEDRLLVLWFLFAFLSSFTAGKPGSTYNHFLELLFVAGLLAGRALPVLSRLLLRPANATSTPRTATPASTQAASTQTSTQTASVLLLFALLAIHIPLAATDSPVDTGIDALRQADTDAALEARLADTPGPVISENAGALVRTGHELLLEPRTMRELAETNEWDDAPFIGALQNQTYTMLVIETFPAGHLCDLLCRFTDDSRAAIRAHYAPDETIGRWQIWTPKADA